MKSASESELEFAALKDKHGPAADSGLVEFLDAEFSVRVTSARGAPVAAPAEKSFVPGNV